MSNTKHTLLIVDDDHAILRTLRRDAAPYFAHVVTADSVQSARSAITGSTSAIIVDIGLPDGTGFEIIESVREVVPTAPILILTGSNDPSTINRAHALEVEFAVKPFFRQNVESFLQRASGLERHRTTRSLPPPQPEMHGSTPTRRRLRASTSPQVAHASADGPDALDRVHALASVGLVASGFVHDMANPLGMLGMNARAIEEMLRRGEVEDALEALQDVLRATEHLKALLHSFGAQVRGTRENVTIGLHDGLEQAVRLVLGTAFIVERDFADTPTDPPVPGSLMRVWTNVLANARDALADMHEPRIRIQTRVKKGSVEVSICDNGPGIPPPDLARVFEPFFSTKGPEHSGLGLSTSRSVVRRIGGDLELRRPRMGHGVEVAIMFPEKGKDGHE